MFRSNGAAQGRTARWAIGLAAGAVLLGHGVTYALVHPDGHERAGVLAATGHAYLHLLEGPGLVLAIMSVLAAAAVGFGRVGDAPDRTTLFRRLAGLQLAAFATMEIAERVASGSLLGAGVRDVLVVVVGLGIQLALARAGAWLLDAVRRTGELLAEVLAHRSAAPSRAAVTIALPTEPARASLAVLSPPPGRGPPSRRR